MKHLYPNVCIEITPSSLLVFIRLHFNGPLSPLCANVIIELPHWNWLVPFFARKIYVQNKHKGNETKTKSMKPKLLKTLNVNQFEPVGLLVTFTCKIYRWFYLQGLTTVTLGNWNWKVEQKFVIVLAKIDPLTTNIVWPPNDIKNLDIKNKFFFSINHNTNVINNFYGNTFGVPKEAVRFWSHASFVTNLKTLAKKLSVVRPKILSRRRKRRKKERQLQSFLHYTQTQ